MIELELTLHTTREVDGRHIAEVPEVPGAIAYGLTRHEALCRAQAAALFGAGQHAMDQGVLIRVVRFTIRDDV
jgi:predicted RNase H-like HicB family nuclease